MTGGNAPRMNGRRGLAVEIDQALLVSRSEEESGADGKIDDSNRTIIFELRIRLNRKQYDALARAAWTAEVPKTGDGAQEGLWAAMVFLGILGVLLLRRKNSRSPK